MKIALIYDELSPEGHGTWVEAEYESPATIDALLGAIRANGCEAVPLPFGAEMVRALQDERPDLAFNIAEGRDGPARESIVPAVLDYLRVPYTGSDGVALGVSLNKAMTKRLAAQSGVPTPPFHLFESGRQAEALLDEVGFPVLAKPNFGGSSVGVEPRSIVREPDRLAAVVDEYVALYEQPCLVEGYVRGRDVTVGLLGNETVEVLPLARVETADGMYSAEVKRLHDREVVCPCELPVGLADRLADWSLRIYRAIGVRDLARVDYMLDEQDNAWFLEVNPLPGLSPYYGLYPVLAGAAGYTHAELIGRIVGLARERYLKSRSEPYGRLGTTGARQHPHR